MTFTTLAVIVLAGLLGPLLALPARWRLPVVLGELAAGFMLGPSLFDVLDASNGTFTFLANIGFALVMFVAGSHVPVRAPAPAGVLRRAGMRAVLCALAAVGLGAAVAASFGTGHTPLYAVLMASSSAALVLPTVDSLGLTGPPVLHAIAQVAIADTACIIALPLAVDQRHAGRAALGSVAVLAAAALAFGVLSAGDRSGLRRRIHRVSQARAFAMELRINLFVLFALAGLAVWARVSIMLAGFTFGLVIARIGEPRRLARQLFAMTDGFLAPLFFVWLGAAINLRTLWSHPSSIVLGVSLGVGAVLAHLVPRATGQPAPLGLLSGAQLGVPIAAVAVGTQLHTLRPGEAAGIILSAMITVAAALTGASVAARRAAAASAATTSGEPGSTAAR